MSALFTAQERVWEVTPPQFDDARDDLEDLIARSRRRGFAGEVTLMGELGIRVRQDPMMGAQEIVVVRARVGGQPATYRGWQVLAEVWAHSTAGAEVRAGAGARPAVGAVLAREMMPPQICGGCGSRARQTGRRVTYLLVDAAMTPVFVGASCLPGLIGDVAAPLVLEDDVIAHLGWDLPQHVSQFFTPATVLVTACAAVLAFGWVPGTRLGSTSARVVAALSAHGSPRAREALAAHLPQGRKLVAGWTDPMSRVPWLGRGVGPRDVGRVLAVYAAELAGQESFAEKGK